MTNEKVVEASVEWTATASLTIEATVTKAPFWCWLELPIFRLVDWLSPGRYARGQL